MLKTLGNRILMVTSLAASPAWSWRAMQVHCRCYCQPYSAAGTPRTMRKTSSTPLAAGEFLFSHTHKRRLGARRRVDAVATLSVNKTAAELSEEKKLSSETFEDDPQLPSLQASNENFSETVLRSGVPPRSLSVNGDGAEGLKSMFSSLGLLTKNSIRVSPEAFNSATNKLLLNDVLWPLCGDYWEFFKQLEKHKIIMPRPTSKNSHTVAESTSGDKRTSPGEGQRCNRPSACVRGRQCIGVTALTSEERSAFSRNNEQFAQSASSGIVSEK